MSYANVAPSAASSFYFFFFIAVTSGCLALLASLVATSSEQYFSSRKLRLIWLVVVQQGTSGDYERKHKWLEHRLIQYYGLAYDRRKAGHPFKEV